jgi:hypothetical protein
MKCLIWNTGDTRPGKATVTLQRGETTVLINIDLRRYEPIVTIFRGFRRGVGRAVMLEHHERPKTTTGGLERLPYGSCFPHPRGVGTA